MHSGTIECFPFGKLLEICVNRHHRHYGQAWFEFERRYGHIMLGSIRKHLFKWNKAADLPLAEDICSNVSYNLTKEDFRALRNFRGGSDEKKFIRFLQVICRNASYAFMIKYVNRKEVGLDLEKDGLQRYISRHPELGEDLIDYLIHQLRTHLLNSNKTAYNLERDIFVFLLRLVCGFKAKEVERIPVLNITQGNVENIVHRLYNVLKNNEEHFFRMT